MAVHYESTNQAAKAVATNLQGLGMEAAANAIWALVRLNDTLRDRPTAAKYKHLERRIRELERG